MFVVVIMDFFDVFVDVEMSEFEWLVDGDFLNYEGELIFKLLY